MLFIQCKWCYVHVKILLLYIPYFMQIHNFHASPYCEKRDSSIIPTGLPNTLILQDSDALYPMSFLKWSQIYLHAYLNGLFAFTNMNQTLHLVYQYTLKSFLEYSSPLELIRHLQ